MLSIFYFIICFLISYTINVFYLFNAIVPLFWIPYVLFKICKGEYKLNALLMCITAPIMWNVVLIILGFLLAVFGLYKYMQAFMFSPGAMWGGIMAIISTLLNMFSSKARGEFIEKLELFKKESI